MGLLDDFTQFIKTPEGQGLLSGAAGWAAGARKGTPWNNIGRGGLAGLSGYANAQDQAMQMSQAEQAKALREMQIAQMRQQFADAELDRGFDPSKFVVPAKPAEMSPSTANAFGLPAQPDQPSYVDRNAMIAEMMRRSPAMKMKALEMMTKEESPLVVGNNLVTKNGKLIFSPPPDPNKMSRADELRLQSELRQDERKFAAQLAEANRVPAQPTLVQVKGKDGNPVYLPAAQAVGMEPWNDKTGAKGSPEKKAQDARMTLPIIDAAESLIPKSTGSRIGAAADAVAGAFGVSTSGAEASAQLKVLEAQLIQNMPRMEGPQSDKDVQLYKQAAAQIGDPNVPNNIKRAALKTLRDITQRNAGGMAMGTQSAAGVIDFSQLRK